MIQQVWQAHLLHLSKQKNHIAHALCAHLHVLLHLFPLPMKQLCKGSPSLPRSPRYPLGLFLILLEFFTFQTYISTKVPKYLRFCLQSSPLGYSYNTIFFPTEKMETGWTLVRMVRINAMNVFLAFLRVSPTRKSVATTFSAVYSSCFARSNVDSMEVLSIIGRNPPILLRYAGAYLP